MKKEGKNDEDGKVGHHYHASLVCPAGRVDTYFVAKGGSHTPTAAVRADLGCDWIHACYLLGRMCGVVRK